MSSSESTNSHYDIIIIGSGPAGQKAAVQAAKVGKRVAMIEADKVLGGACVHRGTIPSKTLRENALRIANLRDHAELFSFSLRPDTEMAALIENMHSVIDAHDQYINRQISRNKIDRIHGRANFVDNKTVNVEVPGGTCFIYTADHFVIATGSVPRQVDNIEVDHEYIYDSDSILSMMYLPQTLTVLGGGVIASEYASIFASLGVRVTMIDRYPRPLGFLDSDLTDRFVHAFEASGAQFIPDVKVERVYWDGVSQVITELEGGRIVRSEKLLSAAGRVANVDGLRIEKAGLSLNDRGIIAVDRHCKTEVDNIYAAGDVTNTPYKQIIIAMGSGATAALGAFDYLIRTPNPLENTVSANEAAA